MADKTQIQDASDDLKQLIADLENLLSNSGTASPAVTDLLTKIKEKAADLHGHVGALPADPNKP